MYLYYYMYFKNISLCGALFLLMTVKYYVNSPPYALVKNIKLKYVLSAPLASLNTVAQLITVFSQVSQTLPTSAIGQSFQLVILSLTKTLKTRNYCNSDMT